MADPHDITPGERMLAGALAGDPDVLVALDPTTALDAVTEQRTLARLRQARAGRTTVLITTNPAPLAACDRVVVLTGGLVAARGDHEELLRREPRYRTSAHARLFPAGGEIAQVILADVSAQGCCVRCPAGTLRVGQFIGIALDEEQPLQAVIRWLRDGAAGLSENMERLHKSCSRLVWLNPLLRWDGFEPKSQGIRAMLPHVDEFRTVHNLASLRALVASLFQPADLRAMDRWRLAA